MVEVALAAVGTALVTAVWLSVLRTLLPTRGSSRTALWIARGTAALLRRAAHPLPELAAPLSLFLVGAGWLSAQLSGFWLLWRAVEPGGASVVVLCAAAVSVLLVVCAFIAYLVRVMHAHDRREVMIVQLSAQVQHVVDADALVAGFLRSGTRDGLDVRFAEWAGWLADVHHSHLCYPALLHQRSTGPLDWPTAAVAVMDAAALVEAIAPSWAPRNTRALLTVGSCCLRCLTVGEGDDDLPAPPVSLHGREERSFSDSMLLAIEAGLPAERDVDEAAAVFHKLRVRYAPYAALIRTAAHER